MNDKTVLNNCNFIRASLLLLVIIYHSAMYWHGDWFLSSKDNTIPFFYYLTEWLNSFHIYALTLVSGFVYAYIKIDKKGYPSFKSLLRSKISRLIVPYVIVALIWVIPNEVYFNGLNFSSIIDYFLLGQRPTQLWFLLMLFGVFVFSYPLTNLFIEKNWLCFLSIIFLFCVGTLAPINNYFQIKTIFQYMLFFWVGAKMYQYRNDFLGTPPRVDYS